MAILLVIVWHYAVEPALDTSPDASLSRALSAFSWAWAGVDLFFVLSGFLIGRVLFEGFGKPGFLLGFYAGRAARLMPAYLAVVAFYFAARPFLADPSSASAMWLFAGNGTLADAVPVWAYLIHVQNIYQAVGSVTGGHGLAMTWSLAVEEQFYLILPILIALTPRSQMVRTIVILICVALAFRTALLSSGASLYAPYILLPGRWDALLAGVLVAYLWQDPAFRQQCHVARRFLATTLMLSIGGLLVCGFAFDLSWSQSWMLTLGFSITAAISVNALLVALVADGVVKRLFTTRWLCRLGVISYGIYLVHQMVLGLMRHFIVGRVPHMETFADAAIAITAFAVTVAVAILSWRWFEQPIIKAVKARRDTKMQHVRSAITPNIRTHRKDAVLSR